MVYIQRNSNASAPAEAEVAFSEEIATPACILRHLGPCGRASFPGELCPLFFMRVGTAPADDSELRTAPGAGRAGISSHPPSSVPSLLEERDKAGRPPVVSSLMPIRSSPRPYPSQTGPWSLQKLRVTRRPLTTDVSGVPFLKGNRSQGQLS